MLPEKNTVKYFSYNQHIYHYFRSRIRIRRTNCFKIGVIQVEYVQNVPLSHSKYPKENKTVTREEN